MARDPLRAGEYDENTIYLWACDDLIATVHAESENLETDRQALCEQRAEFIVRACNAYDDAIEALKAAQRVMAANIPPDAFDGHCAQALVLVKDAIAKLEV